MLLLRKNRAVGTKQTPHMGQKKLRVHSNPLRKPPRPHLTTRSLSVGGVVLMLRKPGPSGKALKDREKERSFLKGYFGGDGCCLYCLETNPWMLNHHHVWGRNDGDFTITLCENHHAALSRHMPFLLEEWYSQPDNEK